MKNVNTKHFYSFDLATLLPAFNQEEVIKAKLADSGAKDVKIDIENTAQGFNVEIQRTMPAEVPSVLKTFLGEWNEVKQNEKWQGSIESGYRCELHIEISGVPVSIKGQMDISSSGILTTNIIEIQVSCGIPLVGGQLESLVVQDVEKSVAKEFAFIKANLG